jgi:hypothetical protein
VGAGLDRGVRPDRRMKYLDLACKLFAGMAAGWDDVCGGV